MLQELEFLKKVLLFRDLDDTALKKIFQAAQIVSRTDGSFFFMESDEALRTFVLALGQVKLSQVSEDGQSVLLGFIGPFREFGIVSAASAVKVPGA